MACQTVNEAEYTNEVYTFCPLSAKNGGIIDIIQNGDIFCVLNSVQREMCKTL